MKRLVCLIAGFLLIVLICGCSQVETGKVTKCKHCGKEIENTVHSITVPFWESDKYDVVSKLTYCDKCGNERVVYKTSYICKYCKSVYNTETNYTLRKKEISDRTVADKYCDKCGDELVASRVHIHCERCGKEYAINKESYKRKLEYKKDIDSTSGFCSTSCKVMKGTEDAGEQIGRWGKALMDGLMKGSEEK